MPKPRSQLLVLLLGMLVVAVLVAVIHWPMLSADALSLDDAQFLTENALVQNPSWESARRFFEEVLAPSTVGGYYLPLSMNSLMLDYAMGGRPEALAAFHRTSLLIHLLNVSLIILLLHLLFGNPWVAAAVGLLFGAHPLTVEPMIWVGERKTLLATFFALVCMVAYVRYVQRPRRLLFWTALMAYVMSLLSKPTVTTLPLLLILMDVWPLGRLSRRALLQKAPFLALGALSAAITLVSHQRTAQLALPDDPALDQTLLMACRNLVFYFKKLAWPVDLTSFYHVPEPLSLSQPEVLAGVLGMALLCAVLVISLRWSPAPLIATAILIVAVSPTLGFVRYSWVLVSDKYLYFPMVGIVLLIAYALVRLLGSNTRSSTRWAAMFLVILALAALEARGVRAYQPKWSDSETLFRHMVQLAPDAALSHNMLGRLLLEKNREVEAMGQFVKAVELDSTHAPAHVDIGNVLFQRGDLAGAMQRWRRALEANPELAEAHTCLAVGLSRQGKKQEAIKSFHNALSLDPDNPYALNNLGMEEWRQGRTVEATRLFRGAVRSKTNYADARLNLGLALARQGQHLEAIEQYQTAARYGADPDVVRRRLADTYIQTNRPAEAARLYVGLVEQRPQDARLRNNYALALIRLQRFDEALGQAREAVEIDSTYADARVNLAFVLEQRGDLEGALQQYRAVLRTQPENGNARQRMMRVLKRLEGG